MNKQVFFKKKKSCPFSGEDGMKSITRTLSCFPATFRKRQDHPEPHHFGFRQETKRIGPRHQTRPLHCSASVCRQLRRNEMEVILLEHVNKLGRMGDKVNVKNGYARNYLLPTKKPFAQLPKIWLFMKTESGTGSSQQSSVRERFQAV